MEAIKVQLREPTVQGRLYYQSSDEIKDEVILLKSRPSKKWSYFINIAGEALLDFDANRILRVAEIVVPKTSWFIQSSLTFITASQVADIELIEPLKSHTLMELPVTVYRDETTSCVCILFGSINAKPSWVELSSQCQAAVVDDELKGFLVALK